MATTSEDLEDVKAPQGIDALTVCVSRDQSDATITAEYHILYSLPYAVPVLYFNMWKQNGKLLCLEDIWKQVPKYFEEFETNKWGAITQQEHPLLGRPYYYIHPCQTAAIMKACFSSSQRMKRNYLITWLSTFAPLVGLEVPLSYGESDELIQKRLTSYR